MRKSENASDNLQSHDDASWVIIGLSMFIFFALQLFEPFGFSSAGIVQSVATILGLFALQYFYTKKRENAKIFAIVTTMTQLIIFSILGAILTYMVAAQGGELWDARLSQWDNLLGLDWLKYLNWVNDHPLVGGVFNLAYVSLIPQLVILLMALGISGKLHSLRVVMFASIFSGMTSILMSGFTPAMSNFIFRGLSPDQYPNLRPEAAFLHQAHLEALRDGTLRYIELSQLQGIVTFPSFHASLGAVFIWGFWRAPIVGMAGVVWAAIMILATPIDGAHYFVDVFAGLSIAALGIAIGKHAVGIRWLTLGYKPFKSSPFRHSHGAFVQ